MPALLLVSIKYSAGMALVLVVGCQIDM